MQAILQQEWKSPDAVSDDAIQLVASIMRESEVVEISEDGYQIRRKDMPADWSEVIAAVAARTVHVALLPYDTTIDKLGTYFSKHGEVNQVRLLKYSDSDGAGAFRGTALIEMSSMEEANTLISNNLEYQGAILRLQSKAGYEEMQAQGPRDRTNGSAVDVLRPVMTVEGLPPDPEASGEENDGSQPMASQRSVDPSGDHNEDQPPAQASTAKPYTVSDEQKGLLIQFEVVGDAEDLCSGRSLREAMGGQAKGVRFVQHKKGSTTGTIRFMTQDQAQAMIAETQESGELEIDSGHKFKLSILTGDEEVAAWKQIDTDAARKDADKRGKRGSGGRGGGGRFAKRGRR